MVKEYQTSMLVKKMDIYHLMSYDKQIEGEKLKERKVRESNRAMFDGGFSNATSGSGGGHFLQGQRSQGHGSSQFLNQRFDNNRVSYLKSQGSGGPTFPSMPNVGEIMWATI